MKTWFLYDNKGQLVDSYDGSSEKEARQHFTKKFGGRFTLINSNDPTAKGVHLKKRVDR